MKSAGTAEREVFSATRAAFTRTELAVVTVLGVAFAIAVAIWAGKDVGWDQKNYHFYSVYAWLTGRVGYDIAPAGQQSWYNPLIYLPHYFITQHARPILAGAIFAAPLGLNATFVYVLARQVISSGLSLWWSRALALLAAAVGMSDPFFLEFIGSTDIDNLLSIPVVAALCLLCVAVADDVAERARHRAYLGSGFLLGAASGLKLTCLVFALGAGLALLVLWRLLGMTTRRFARFCVGGALGFLVTGGYWSWLLWKLYDNPFFPHWNRYFRSDWAITSNFRDMRFPPQSAEAAFMYPFQWFVGLHPSSEDQFRDARFAVVCVLILIVTAALTGQWIANSFAGADGSLRNAEAVANRRRWWLLVLYFILSYIAWMKLFGIQRYLVPLSVVTGVVLWLLIDWLIQARGAKVGAFAFLAVFSVWWVRIDINSWRLPYGDSWFGVQLAPEVQRPGTLFVMVGGGPMGYIVPYLPESTRIVRLVGITTPPTDTRMVAELKSVIANHTGEIRSLSIEPLTEADYAHMKRFGVELNQSQCITFRSLIDQFTSCHMDNLPNSPAN